MKSISHSLLRQKEAAKTILAQLKEAGIDDEESFEIAIESETNLLEVISKALDKIDEDDVLDAGLTAKIEAFTERRNAIRKQKDFLRTSIEQAMLIAEQETMRLPTATLTLRKVKPGTVIETEAEIPSRFWTPQETPAPKLNKKILLEALEAGETIPGARLDNGSIILTVRRK
ncbi:siphovirus Gp157 family protein [Ochrobactrum sp. AN78]|uniref:siphovirus Gp157 family protein n=1 Tax=Ochrobactrum sp. AN78 TaxID=3039853 RepID=UPI002989E9DD|nr:siphovirus Gp157 family protein [Ochrobactrum sp. AN78]MDH7790699.1 hypothetical protein [Ochrobactrum sp. AN78]